MLTPQGADIWQRTMGVVERRNAEIMSCLNEAEIEQLDVFLDRLVAHAQKASQGVAESED
jgi:DNA-binding MarR family transcriptional regulator